MQKKIGIIGAMSIEIEFLKRKLVPEEGFTSPKQTEAGKITFTEGKINGIPVVLVQSGIGKVNAALCAQRLIIQFGVTHIINTGIAGATAAGLKVLDFVVSSDAVYHDMDATAFGYKATEIPQMECSDFTADKELIKAVEKAFNKTPQCRNHKLLCGRIASGDKFVGTKELKESIKNICSPACVEMEGAAIAHTCWINGIPFVIIRCMSDTADESVESGAYKEEEAADLSANLVLSMLADI